MKIKNLEKCFTNQGKFLRKVRLANGLSQGQLAELLGLNTFQSISNAERYLQATPFYLWVIIHNNYPFDWNELKDAMIKDHESWIMDHYLLTNEGMNQEQISQQ